VARHEGHGIASVHDDESLDWELLPGRKDALKVPDDPLVRRELAEMLPYLGDVRASDASGQPLQPFPTASLDKGLNVLRSVALRRAETLLFPKPDLDRATDLAFCREATRDLDSKYARGLVAMKIAEEYYQRHRPTLAEGPAGLAALKRRSLGDGINIRWSPSFQIEEMALGFELDILRRSSARALEGGDDRIAEIFNERIGFAERALGIVGRASAPPKKRGRQRRKDLREILRTVKRRMRSLEPEGRLTALKACGWEKPPTKLNIEAVALCLIGADRFGWTFANMTVDEHEERIARLRAAIMGREQGRRSPHKPEKKKKRIVH
jgi:hypothetical protein